MISRRFRGIATIAVVVLLGAFTTPLAASAVDYPSWDDVQAARGNEAATQATIAQIDGLLTGLRDEAARLGDAAVARGAEAEEARADLTAATGRADALQRRADAAAAVATDSSRRAGQIVAQLYRSGANTSVTAFFLPSSSDSDGLLYRMGALGKLSEQTERQLTAATIDVNQAEALHAQASVAKTERDQLAKQAESALAAALDAQRQADAQVAEQEARSATLFDQLALLRNSTAQVERDYRAGQQAAKDFADQAAGSENAAGPGGGNDGGFTVPSSSINDPVGARAIAAQMVADRGWGSDQYSCLALLWNRESGWRTNAYNASSGAYGIPQSLPGSKMGNVAADWRTNPATQITWGLAYITSRYGAPCGAWAHSQSVGWY